jgi:hypothetical protein
MSDFSISRQKDSIPDSTLPNTNFPLADLSSVMFPNPDPFAYPNQQSGAESKFDDLMKNLSNAPLFSGCQDQYTPEESIALSDLNTTNQQQPYMLSQDLQQRSLNQDSASETDVQLLGPMPMYLMQGTSPGVGYQDYEHLFSNNPATADTAQETQPAMSQSEGLCLSHLVMRQNQMNKRLPNVASNLNNLLGGSEWAGLPADRSVMGGFLHSPVPTVEGALPDVKDSNFDQMQSSSPHATFQEPRNTILAWNIEGY